MINRQLTSELSALVKQFPAVAILGARQVGKTTLAQQIAGKLKKKHIYLDLEKVSDRQKLEDDADGYLSQYKDKCVIIDEVQQLPQLFTALRPLIDEHRKPGRFILLGSASPHLVKGVSESLAGRIAYVELTPLNYYEVAKKNIDWKDHWLRGGYPDALFAKTNKDWHKWANFYVRSYVERDLNHFFGVNLSPVTIRKFWTMLSGNNGAFWNAENYARSLGITSPTATRYMEFLEGAFLIRSLPSWSINVNKRVVKAPKIYVRDSGLLHFLCNINDFDGLQNSIALGASWEGYVIEQICSQLKDNIHPYYYRTQHGAEVDLLIVKGNRPHIAIEIKYSTAPTVTKGFYQSIEDVKAPHKFVIIPSGDTWKNGFGIIHCSLNEFISKHLNKLLK